MSELTGRKLSIFFDGSSKTAASAEQASNTNVFRLNQSISNGSRGEQISFYYGGVGTHGDPHSSVTGAGFDQILMEAYTNLSSNYLLGDSIYIFGFSRGAAAARALSSLISFPGLLQDTYIGAFPIVWKVFLNKIATGSVLQREYGLIRQLLVTVRAIPIRFLGAFDAVAGSNWDKAKLFAKVRFDDLTVSTNVEHAVHILALDDNRIPSFSPLVWEGCSKETTLEQIWMPGVHGDVGGDSDSLTIGRLALLTMLERLNSYCPELELDYRFIDEMVDEVRKEWDVSVSNERAGLIRKALYLEWMLYRKTRTVGRGCNEVAHELIDRLKSSNRRFQIRNRSTPYSAAHCALQSRYTPKHLRFLQHFSDVYGKIGL